MFNLIPQSLKGYILADYKERRIVVILVGVVFLILIAFVFLAPSLGYLFFEEKNILAEVEAMKSLDQFKKVDQVETSIKDANEQLRALLTEVSPVDPIRAIERVIAVKNSGVHITDMQYQEITATSSSLVMRGSADKRDALKQFVTNVQALPGFADVVLPVSNFAKDKDIDFSISVTIYEE